MEIFNRLESNVRGYIRSFPTVFTTASGSVLTDEDGKEYIDFFAGAGVLNYGHNHPLLKRALLTYLAGDNVVHSLDMGTVAKRRFLETFERSILAPRGMRYKMQFPGPTGTNAVEAALKLARKVTGRPTIASFTNGFHGMTLGALATTGNDGKRQGAGVPLSHVTRLPFENYPGFSSSIDAIRAMLTDLSSGVDKPAAVLIETVQAEGGVNVASWQWLRDLRQLTAELGILMIVDDIQVGCGRTGSYFSFEHAEIEPDIICLSKSLSGYGLPFALVLMKPEIDVWEPGEHNGTFRGHNPAFVTATAACSFWENNDLQQGVGQRADLVGDFCRRMTVKYNKRLTDSRHRGLIAGIEGDPKFISKVSSRAFRDGLIIETAGANDQVLKFLPPLNIPISQLEHGLHIVENAIHELAVGRRVSRPTAENVPYVH